MIFVDPTIGIAVITDDVWGRLYKFGGAGDAGLIMPPRSYYFRSFNAGNWTNLVMGMIYTGTANATENTAVVNETLSSLNFGNLFHFGLSKANPDGTIDVEDNQNFLGMRGLHNSVHQIFNSPTPAVITQVALTSVKNGVVTEDGSSFSLPLTRNASTALFSMIGMRFMRDTTNNTVKVFYEIDESVDLTSPNVDSEILQNFLTQLSDDPNDAQGEFSISSVANLTTFYIFWPWILNRMKLQAIGAIKFST
jgi:hypothetical protein